MKETIECNTCGQDNCNRKEAIKRTQLLTSVVPFCTFYREPKVAKYRMVESAVYSEIVKYGKVKNISQALRLK
jgi:hypothetical protein